MPCRAAAPNRTSPCQLCAQALCSSHGGRDRCQRPPTFEHHINTAYGCTEQLLRDTDPARSAGTCWLDNNTHFHGSMRADGQSLLAWHSRETRTSAGSCQAYRNPFDISDRRTFHLLAVRAVHVQPKVAICMHVSKSLSVLQPLVGKRSSSS